MKNVTDFRKTVETGVDPRQLRFYHFEPKSIVLSYFLKHYTGYQV